MKKIKKYLWLVIPFLGAFTIIYLLYENSYSEFKPTVLDGETFKVIKVDSNFQKNIQTVLDYHNETYRIGKQGRILVKKRIINDYDLLITYTRQALDSTWSHLHKIDK